MKDKNMNGGVFIMDVRFYKFVSFLIFAIPKSNGEHVQELERIYEEKTLVLGMI